MAHIAQPMSAPGLVSRFFTAIWDGLVALGESSARARLAREVCNMSDAELKAAGVERSDLIRRVMTDGYQL